MMGTFQHNVEAGRLPNLVVEARQLRIDDAIADACVTAAQTVVKSKL